MSNFTYWKLHISIHAPREGCDRNLPAYIDERYLISIHAPREGCDGKRPENPYK